MELEKSVSVVQIKVTEREFQDQIVELGHLYHWQIAHFRPARKLDGSWATPVSADGKGWPDLVLVRGDRVIFAEAKSENGKLSQEQREWLDLLKATKGVEVYLWKPSIFEDIVELLK